MTVSSRKNRMIQNIMKIQEAEKKNSVKGLPKEEITKEDHKTRLKMLKDLGMVK